MIVLITGASSGIGKTCAEHLISKGYKVYGTSRKAKFPPEGHMIQMDVRDDDSVRKCIDYIIEREGRIDVVVNNAGIGIAGAVEETTIEEAKNIFETNFFGVHRVCRAVLPIMRRQRSGLIVNISSIMGLIALPFQPFYSAAKFALEGYSEALRMEVKPFGIKVVLIEPGDINTPFVDNRKIVENRIPDYKPYFDRVMSIVERNERGGPPPEVVAKLLERVIKAKNPKPRYRVGPFMERVAANLKGVIPDGIFEKLVMRNYGIG
ncbi:MULTISPECIES: SDR family oxidoreductase [unclassified Archaeoglobus]|jgi:NAD(P)-dependent dehydrogenase (short-subunit alcohol dehydrogenase family)|uniref:SDR family oxidoreductase n=1 Tax=unclassified Archaeoglobus TaxID=2643606 RepID=UPI0025B7C10F|nr:MULTISPECIES: SDR family oxidoreductase [unclassified Archaeoglobus]